MNVEPKRLIVFECEGEAHPKGSMKAVPIPGHNGPFLWLAQNLRVNMQVADSNNKVKPYMRRLAKAAVGAFTGTVVTGKGSRYSDQCAEVLSDRPLILRVTVEKLRPQSHYLTDGVRLRKGAPLYPDTKPDMGKLIRAVEDALENVIYTNDSRIIRHETEKRYGERDRTIVEILALPKNADELAAWDSIDVFAEVD